ncbi:VOC family protein [Anabaena sp. UHCC 0399]|uniref:VOC family protein n=1 Tax=Anabaena sp. UHCC 0399 TaxID=3110238 RepID=UPI002B1F8D32|nr:VOC family protein [Anabaena sp. UHCC 0399]MEA5565011.1 VOC family protein [Anabaena sp. UHCC 0399]
MMQINKKAPAILNRLFSKINQVCIVTNNFDETIHKLSKYLGIGPFKCWYHKPPRLFNTKVYGKEVHWTMKVAIAWIGNIQLEVIEPLEGTTLYSQYLQTNGEGVEHILLDTGNLSLDKSIKQLAKLDCCVIQEGMLNIPVQIGFLSLSSIPRFLSNLLIPKFVYFDTKVMAKVTFEMLKLPPLLSLKNGISITKPDYWIPEGNTNINSSLSNSFINQIFKIGILTYDLDKTLRNYVEILGIGPWKIYHLQEPRLSQTKLRGKKVNLSVQIAVAYVGNTLLEIVQPLDGSSIYHELLDKQGEGVHYIGVSSDKLNFSELLQHFSKLGCSIAMEGTLENTYQFAYVDTKSLAKMMMEVVSIPVQKIPLALESLKPDKIYPNLG